MEEFIPDLLMSFSSRLYCTNRFTFNAAGEGLSGEWSIGDAGIRE